MQEIIQSHRSAESHALYGFLTLRGVRSDDLMFLVSDALERYAEENP